MALLPLNASWVEFDSHRVSIGSPSVSFDKYTTSHFSPPRVTITSWLDDFAEYPLPADRVLLLIFAAVVVLDARLATLS